MISNTAEAAGYKLQRKNIMRDLAACYKLQRKMFMRNLASCYKLQWRYGYCFDQTAKSYKLQKICHEEPCRVLQPAMEVLRQPV